MRKSTEIDRLSTDHDNARLLAEGLVELGWEVDPPETNIVMAGTSAVSSAAFTNACVAVRATSRAGPTASKACRRCAR